MFDLWLSFLSHPGMCNNGPVTTLMLVLLTISTNGHYVIITKDIIRSLSDKFNVEVPHQLSIEFPLMCKHAPSNCQPYLLQFHSMVAELFMPSVDPVQHLKLINTTIGTPNVLLGVTTCFRYVPTGHGNEVYALCLKNHTVEITLVIYKIRYTKDFEIEPSPAQHGNGYGTHINLDSPLIVTFSESNDPVVLYIANVRGNAMLYIKDLNAGGDVHDHMPLPSDCSGPYELRELHQLDALLKCSNGLVYSYHGDTWEFTKMPVQGITMLERCANSSLSFVMITRDDTIMFGETILRPLTFQPNAISSFMCHWNGTVTNFYFTIPQDNGMIHYMSIPLEHANPATVPHLMLKLSNREPLYSFDVTRSSIVGSAWIIKLFDSDNDTQETVLIDIDKEISDNRLSDDMAYVLSLKSVLEHDDGNGPGEFQGGDDPQTSGDSNKPPMLIIITSVVIVIVLLFTIVGSILLCILYRRNPRRRARHQSYSTLQTRAENDAESSEHETHIRDLPTQSHDQGNHLTTTDDSPLSTSNHDQGNHQTATSDPTSNHENHDQGNHLTTTDDSPLFTSNHDQGNHHQTATGSPTSNHENHDQGHHQTATGDCDFPLPTSGHDDDQSLASNQSGNTNTLRHTRMYVYVNSTDSLVPATSESTAHVTDEITAESVVADRLHVLPVATDSSNHTMNDSTERDRSESDDETNVDNGQAN